MSEVLISNELEALPRGIEIDDVTSGAEARLEGLSLGGKGSKERGDSERRR